MGFGIKKILPSLGRILLLVICFVGLMGAWHGHDGAREWSAALSSASQSQRDDPVYTAALGVTRFPDEAFNAMHHAHKRVEAVVATGQLITSLAFQWYIPEHNEWPLDGHGNPIINTRRVNDVALRNVSPSQLTRMRQRYRVSWEQLKRFNPDLEIDNVNAQQSLVVWQRPEELSKSIGTPNRGRLIHGEPMPESDYYRIIHPHRTFGTYYTISETVRALDAYYDRYSNADPLMIGDASLRTGRRVAPHNSHQSGRDIDISLPRRNPPPNYRKFHRVTRNNLDVEKTLWLIDRLIMGGFVEYIFVDRTVQRQLYRKAQELGAPEEWLERAFQYPSYAGGDAIVRHARGHRNHLHIRFYCQQTDIRCH